MHIDKVDMSNDIRDLTLRKKGQADQCMTKFCKLFHIHWINKFPLYSMGNSVFSIL